jgi:hypothetical protein
VYQINSRGHASAPNKRLQTLLARRVSVSLYAEYGTSKHSCCCHERAVRSWEDLTIVQPWHPDHCLSTARCSAWYVCPVSTAGELDVGTTG